MKGHRIPAAGKAPPSSGPLLDPPPPAPKPSTGAAELLVHARDLVAAIEEHIDKRAEEKAGPLIEAAAEQARQMVAQAERETQRQRDLAGECRKRIQVLEGRERQMTGYRDRLVAALGRHPSTPWPSLVAEIEAKLKGSGQ